VSLVVLKEVSILFRNHVLDKIVRIPDFHQHHFGVKLFDEPVVDPFKEFGLVAVLFAAVEDALAAANQPEQGVHQEMETRSLESFELAENSA